MEARLFPDGTVPEYTTALWYAERESAPHVDQDLHRPRLDLAAAMINALEPASVIDLGAGDGGLLTLLDDAHPGWGFDLQLSNVEAAARRGVNVRLVDVVALLDQPGALLDATPPTPTIAVATEMLEHLVDPHRFVRRILDHDARYLVASSPWTETAEAHYGFHTWAWDRDGYAALVTAAGWRVRRHETTGMFQVLLAERP
jgi:hypothetical protein